MPNTRPIRISARVDMASDLGRILCDHDAEFPCDPCWQACYALVLELSAKPGFEHLNRKA